MIHYLLTYFKKSYTPCCVESLALNLHPFTKKRFSAKKPVRSTSALSEGLGFIEEGLDSSIEIFPDLKTKRRVEEEVSVESCG